MRHEVPRRRYRAEDTDPMRIDARDGSILFDPAFFAPKPGSIQAGLDILDLNFVGQHFTADETTIVRGGDIRIFIGGSMTVNSSRGFNQRRRIQGQHSYNPDGNAGSWLFDVQRHGNGRFDRGGETGHQRLDASAANAGALTKNRLFRISC
ncbi:hypothetical protein ACVJGD_004586 [Bradyrhizobium sp. USDA 10063]